MRWIAALFLVLCGCPSSPRPQRPPPDADPVVAWIGDDVVRRSEAERRVAMEIFRRQVDIHSLVEREIDALVERRLLEAESERRGVSVEAMLEKELKATRVPKADVDAYLAERGLGEDRRERARNYLDGRKGIERRLMFVARLREAAKVRVDLPPPELPRIDVDISNAPVRGPEGALVTLVHFGSFNDLRSAEVASWIADVRRRHGAKVREVFRHALKSRDELGLKAALLAREAQKLRRFWDVHDRLFAHDDRLDGAVLETLAADLGIGALDEAARTSRIVALRSELDIATKSGVTAPPVVFVNGRWFQHSFGRARFDAIVEQALVAPSLR